MSTTLSWQTKPSPERLPDTIGDALTMSADQLDTAIDTLNLGEQTISATAELASRRARISGFISRVTGVDAFCDALIAKANVH